MSAIAYISSLKGFITKGEFTSETSIFRLHYQFTVAILLGSSVLLSAAEFFSTPINCITDLPVNVINTYCWIKTTYTIQDYSARAEAGLVPQPGIKSPRTEDDVPDDEEEWRFHNYYQWVVFFLFFQSNALTASQLTSSGVHKDDRKEAVKICRTLRGAALCYFPKWLWDNAEGGLMSCISSGLNMGLYKDEDVGGRKKVVIDYIVTHIKVLEQTQLDQSERVDPMIYVFPRMTKCHFRKFGHSGTIEKHDAFCLLPLNIFNEKVFIMIWFWFVILAFLLGCQILFRLALLFFRDLRPRVIHGHNRGISFETFEALTNKISIGDWWILYILSRNIDPLIYRDIMVRLTKEIETSNSNNPYNNRGGIYSSSSV